MKKKYFVRLTDEERETLRGVDWQFTINDARYKLKSLYPTPKW
jgi:hypothetical protein